MEGTDTNQKSSDENSDWLSNLPDSLLIEILALLKAREVAQTCILSKRWLKIWSFVPSLCFDIEDFLDRDARRVTYSVLKKFRKFVSSFLRRRDKASNIHTFRLLCQLGHNFKCNPGKTAALAREWVLYALKRNPKILEISFSGGFSLNLPDFLFTCVSGEYSLNLPDCFFTCETLEDVNLYFDTELTEDMKPKRVCLPKLRNLELSYANFSDDYLERFISGCPALQSLSLVGCTIHDFCTHTVKQLELIGCTIDTVTISAPAVEILDFDGDMETRITLKDASKVARAKFMSWDDYADDEYSCNLLTSLSSVEHLLIDTVHLEEILESELPKCPTFISMKNLTLGKSCMVDGDHSGEESGENFKQIKGFPCEGLQMVKITYYESDCAVHELEQLILQRTREIEGVQIILTECKRSRSA